VLAHGTEATIIDEGIVGVFIHVHLKNSHENITNPKVIAPRKVKTENCKKANSSKERAKTGWFCYDSVPELNTKNLGNSPRFLSVTDTALSA
jgi:hypothetical protein